MGVYFMNYIWINLDTQQWLIHKLTVYLVRVKIGRWKWVQEKWGENDMKWYLVKGGEMREILTAPKSFLLESTIWNDFGVSSIWAENWGERTLDRNLPIYPFLSLSNCFLCFFLYESNVQFFIFLQINNFFNVIKTWK